MKNNTSHWVPWAILAISSVLSSVDSALAYWSWPFIARYDDYCEEHVPYFVLHPPVQYGYSILNAQVPGRSCCADQAASRPRRPAPAPLLIINPYCSDDIVGKPVPVQTARRPLRIINPFVERPDSDVRTQSEVSIPTGMLLAPVIEPILP